jgi:uncharacterized protein
MTRERVDEALQVIDRFDRSRAMAEELGLARRPAHAHAPDGTGTGSAGSRYRLFGGEPLTAATRDVVAYIVEQARRRGASLWAITNGVQLDRFAGLLGPDGLADLQVTLDGLPALHDRRRVGPGLRRTFDLIVDNVDRALAAGARVDVRINVDESNADQVPLLDDFFAERGWADDPRFRANAAVVTGEARHQPLVSHADLVAQTSALRTEGAGCVRSYEG